MIIPLKFKYFVEKAFFIETGIETEWLLNYSTVSRRPDFSWLLGFGYKKQDLQLSLSYTQGFEDQYMGESNVGNWMTSQGLEKQNVVAYHFLSFLEEITIFPFQGCSETETSFFYGLWDYLSLSLFY